jgi:hypothetical protein
MDGRMYGWLDGRMDVWMFVSVMDCWEDGWEMDW